MTPVRSELTSFYVTRSLSLLLSPHTHYSTFVLQWIALSTPLPGYFWNSSWLTLIPIIQNNSGSPAHVLTSMPTSIQNVSEILKDSSQHPHALTNKRLSSTLEHLFPTSEPELYHQRSLLIFFTGVSSTPGSGPFIIQDSMKFQQEGKPCIRQHSHQNQSTYKGTLCRAPQLALTSFSRWSSRTFGAWWQPWGPARAASPGWNTWAHSPGSPGHHDDSVL